MSINISIFQALSLIYELQLLGILNLFMALYACTYITYLVPCELLGQVEYSNSCNTPHDCLYFILRSEYFHDIACMYLHHMARAVSPIGSAILT